MSSDKISRRSFATLAAAAVMLPAAARPSAKSMKRQLIKPPRLKPGDTIALVAPGGHVSEVAIENATARVTDLGFKVRHSANLRAVHGNYGGTVQQRLLDLHTMFADPDIKALWAVRGGSGAISLLAGLNYKLIRANPKVLLGYSDITALHLAIVKHAGLVTFHGPVAMSSQSDYSNEHLMAVLTDPRPSYTIPMALENSRRALEEPHYAVRTVHHGVATGPLVGGNLSLVAALAGTPYAADFRKAILFLEEVNEEPYRIDRWMTQLDLAGGFNNAAALMIGICDNCGPVAGESALTLEQTFDQHLLPLASPAVTGYSFGHIRNQFTLPMGIKARLDTQSQTLTLLEAAVS